MKTIMTYPTKRSFGRTGLRGLGKTLAGLSKYTEQFAKLQEASFGHSAPGADSGDGGPTLTEIKGFGANPGALRMFVHVPAKLPKRPALVVALHGCTQTARSYDHGSGWSALADRHGFIVLLPEQQSINNPKSCFNWFQNGDTARDQGEALSIRQMIDRAVADHQIDPARVFITGLSAGGAMTASMLAAYPEVFAGGAIIAGLPHGAASNVNEALNAMFQGKSVAAKVRGNAVRAASSHKGKWPRVSIWHGDADATVKPINGAELVKQWTDVHAIGHTRPQETMIGGTRRRIWSEEAGQPLVSEYVIPGMGHGTPLDMAQETGHGEHAGAFFLDVGISSTTHIAESWGLTGPVAGRTQVETIVGTGGATVSTAVAPGSAANDTTPHRKPAANDGMADSHPQAAADSHPQATARPAGFETVESVITKALRSAGLMK
jgi:feruloyl esterase